MPRPRNKPPVTRPVTSRAKPSRSRGRFKSLRVSTGFRDFVLDQLASVRDLRANAMFGGIGLYSGDLFFGIVAADVLYFKVGDANRAEYVRAGSKPFTPYTGRTVAKKQTTYYEVPVAVLEDAALLGRWAAGAIAAAAAS